MKTYIKQLIITGLLLISGYANSQQVQNQNDLSHIPTIHSVDKSKDVGEIPIEQSTQNGGLIYSIPIEIYAGYNNFSPDPKIIYNSLSNNGVAGHGWQIGCLSSISPVSTSLYYDNTVAPAKNDKYSSFTLDGVRLIDLKTGNNEVTNYQTESGNIKVSAYLTGNTIKYFVVKYTNGSTATYGFESNAVPKSSYPLTQITDILGNVINYSYSEVYNVYYLSEINYGGRIGTNSLSNYAKVKFFYESRNDIIISYVDGFEQKMHQRLYSIETYFNNELSRLYTFSYEYKTSSLLKKVECVNNGKSLNPLIFYYGENNEARVFNENKTTLSKYFEDSSSSNLNFLKGRFYLQSENDGLIVYPKRSPYKLLDENNSGRKYGSDYKADDQILVYGNLTSSLSTPSTLTAEKGLLHLFTADLDGNGIDKLVKINSNLINSTTDRITFKVYEMYQASGQTYPGESYSFSIDITGVIFSGGFMSPHNRAYLVGDFLGKGKQTVLSIRYSDTFIGSNMSSWVTLIDFDTKSKSSLHDKACFDLKSSDVILALDHDGDGKTDICHVNSSGMHVYSFDNAGNLVKIASQSGTYPHDFTQRQLFLGDVNGDGKTDIVLSPKKDMYTMVKYHHGQCYGCCNVYNGTKVGSSADGKVQYYKCNGSSNVCQFEDREVKKYEANAATWTSYLSTGKGFVTPYTTDISVYEDGKQFVLQDMNNDGKSDLVVNDNGTVSVYLSVNGKLGNNAETAKTYINKDGSFIPGSVLQNYKMSQLFAVYKNELKLITYSRDDAGQQLLTGVVNSSGVINKHKYSNIRDAYGAYKNGSLSVYPHRNLIGNLNLLSAVESYLNNSLIASANFSYTKGVVNLQGRGFLGFEQITTSDNVRNISSTQTFDPINFGVLKSVDSPVSSASYNYTFTVASNKTALVTVSNKTEKDKLKDISVTSTYTYDAYGNPTKEIKDYGGGLKTTTDKKYNNLTGTPYILGQVSEESVTNERSGTSASVKAVLVYNTKGQVTTKKNYYGANQTAEESFTYDANNNLTEAKSKSYTSANWLVKKYSYDTYGRITTETDPLGFTTTYGYDTKGQLNSVKNHKAHETKYEYDIWGRKTKTTYADGSVETSSMAWASSPAGALILSTTTATGQPATQLYVDALGREVRKGVMRFDGKYLYTDNVYDSKGRVQKTSLPFKGAAATQWNTPAYDSYDRIVSLTYASGKKDSYAYDKNKVTATIDNVAKTTTYDATGKVISVTDPAGTITYNLRADGQPSSIVAPGSITTSFEYDTYGRQTKLIDPSAGTSVTAYDAAGNISQQTDANGKVTKLAYDAYNRMTTKEVVGELTTTYTYNTDGQLQSVSGNNSTSVAYTYDNLMRVATEKESVVDGKWLQKTFTYANGITSAIAYSSNLGSIATENYVYTNGNMSEIKLNNATSIWKLTQENDLGLATGATTGALTRTYGYDAFGLPTARVIKNGATAIQNFSYNFTATTGNLNWRKDNNRNIQENFTYDNLNRLTGFGGKTITYDVKGNITDFTTVGKFSYTNTSKPYAVTEISPYGTEIPLRNQTITYNGMMRPSSITEDIYRADFIYNTDAERVRMQIKKNNAVDLTRYYIGGQYEFETGVAGTKEKLYLGGDAYSAAAVYVKEGTGAWQIYYIGRDYLGSITHIIDAVGTVKQELSYDPWGRLRNAVNQELYAIGNEPALFLARGYTGHEHLPMFGLINMNARLYDPVIGRFLSPDPYVQAPDWSQNFNRFSYALNNPLRFNDPSGKFINILIGAAIGAVINWSANGFQFNAKGLAHFGVGALAGGIGAGAGQLVSGAGFIAGAASGALTGFTSGLIAGTGNAILAGSSMARGVRIGVKSGLIGAGIGAAVGGFVRGIEAAENGTNFFTAKGNFDISQGVGAENIKDAQDIIKAKYVGKFEGVSIFESDKLGTLYESSRKWSGGVALPGKGIIVGEGVFSKSFDTELLKHEFGHILQAQKVGLKKFYSVIAKESLESAMKHGAEHSHNHFWTETWANYLSKNYFGGEWNAIRFPVQDISFGNKMKFIQFPLPLPNPF